MGTVPGCTFGVLELRQLKWLKESLRIWIIHPYAPCFLSPHGSPTLKEPHKWSETFKDFMARCLEVNTVARATAEELLEHPFMLMACDTKELVPLIVKAQEEIRKSA